MKYFIAILLCFMTAGCTGINTNIRSARVNVVSNPTPEASAAMFLQADVQPILESCPEMESPPEAPRERWDLPPFAWAPGACNNTSHEKTWPDYSNVNKTKCTWWFYPYKKNIAGCKSTWILMHGSWTMDSMECEELKQNNIKLRRGGTLSDAMADHDAQRY